MENWKKDSRKAPVIVDIDALVPKDHLLRKIETVMDYEWLYERLDPYYCHDNGRPGTDPVVLIKMVLIQHLFGIPSLRQTYREIQVNVAYRWFLGYSLLDEIPHFATVSYAFCKRFPAELSEEIFAHILNKALNNRMVDPSEIFIDGTHIKASANKKKYQKEQVVKTAKIYQEQLSKEVAAEREALGKKTNKKDDDDDGTPGGGSIEEMTERTTSTTDPDSGLFVKGEHEKQFAYEAHTACDRKGFILGVHVTAGNVHDSVAWDPLYDNVTERFPEVEYVTMDSAYKTPWIAKRSWMTTGSPFFLIRAKMAQKTDTVPGTTYMIRLQIPLPVLRGKRFVTPQRPKKGKEYTEARPKNAEDVPVVRNAEQMRRGRKFCRLTSGRNIWIWWNRFEKQRCGRIFTQGARRRLSVPLRMRKKSTGCVIHTTEVWPGLQAG